MKIILTLILTTQIGCSFVITAAGSFVGNLGAEIAHDKLKEEEKESEQLH